MTCGRVHVALCAAALAGFSSGQAWAQDLVGAQQNKPRPAPVAPQAPPSGQTPRPAELPPGPGGPGMPQGFSVVLVLADLTATGAQDDVPPAARRALADMKDFLPYKSYKLLDAAWLLGHGSMSVRLRGAEEQEYDLRLVASQQHRAGGQVSIQFSLRDASPYEGNVDAALQAERLAATHVAVQARGELGVLQTQLVALETETRRARESGDDQKVRELEAKLTELRSKMRDLERRADARAAAARPVTSRKTLGSRPIIDTSFAMDVGETVVVGTSRLKGNSRALIALLTAVPPNRSRLPESR